MEPISRPFHRFKSNKAKASRNTIERNLIKQLTTDRLNLQILSRQKNFLRFFSRTSTIKQEKYTYHDLLKVIDNPPSNLIAFFSTHVFNRVSIWIQKFISMPKEAATAISHFFGNDYKLQFFANVTFPSIYHHFTTKEFCDSAAQLVVNMVLNEPKYISNAFVLSYLQSSAFCESLWYNFDSSDYKEDFYPRFIRSIKVANACLTKSQIQILTHLFESSKTNFGRVIYGRLLLKSYLELHENQENSLISKLLQAMIVTTRSSQFNEIYEAIIDQKYSLDKSKLIKIDKFNRIPVVLSACEIYTIQCIVQSSPSVFDYPIKEPQNLKVQDSFQNDLTQLNFEIDLTSQFEKNSSISYNSFLFGEYANKANFIIPDSKYENYFNWAEFVIEQEANHELYSSLIKREKFSKSQMIKIYSKKLIIKSENDKPAQSTPTMNWLSRLNKINFYPSAYSETNIQPEKPKIESKVFRYSLNNFILNCQNREAKLWIFLRSYAKCDRIGIFDEDQTNFCCLLKKLKNNYDDDIDNPSFNNFFSSFSSIINTFLIGDKLNTVQLSGYLGIIIKDASNHFSISADQILLKLLIYTPNIYLIENIVWSSLMLRYVPEIKKLLTKGWIDGLSFIIELLHNLIFKLNSVDKNSKDSLVQDESDSPLDNNITRVNSL